MNFRPLHDRLLIRRVDPEAKTTGGIIIPDTAQEKPVEGDVIAVGPGPAAKTERCTRSTSGRATAFYSRSGPARRFASTARI